MISEASVRPDGRPGDAVRLTTMRTATRRRRPGLAVASVALVALSVAIFCSIYARAGRTDQVLVVTHLVPLGQVITTADLGTVRITQASDLPTIAASDEPEVVGRRAAVFLASGTLLTTSALSASYAPPTGRALVGVQLKTGQLPADGVSPGSLVDVILTGAPGNPLAATAVAPSAGAVGAVSGEPTALAIGTILASAVPVAEVVATPGGTDVAVVSLEVPATAAPTIAAASTAGQLALVTVSPLP
ncbi:MAG TPA: SAF domain-containing protein [Acidimicrobiales bacterium]|nr:SAF domain-containing protein [Acidimicrobiales bacterium]